MQFKSFKSLFLAFVIAGLSQGLSAHEEKSVEIQKENEEIIHLTSEEELALHQQNKENLPEELQQAGLINLEASYGFYDNDQAFLHRIHPTAYYYQVAETITGDNIRLNDGSVWYVHPYQRYIVKNWLNSQPLFIKPNASWLSSYSYPYVLQNRETREIVEVSLLNPSEFGESTYWIIGIDSYARLVYLANSMGREMVWFVSPRDRTLNKWREGQRLIIGVNNKWREAEFPHVLINTGIYNAPFSEAIFVR